MTAAIDPTSAKPPAPLLSKSNRLGRWCASHPWLVLGVWVAVLLAATLGHGALGGTYSDNFTLPNSPSEQGAALLRAHEPGAGGQGGQLVFTVESGTLERDRSAIEQAVTDVRRTPHVLSASDPWSAGTVSANGRTAVATVHFDTNPGQLGQRYVHQIDAAVAPAKGAGVRVNYGGALGQAARTKNKDGRSAAIGIVVALVVLLFGFGSVYAAGLPLVSAGLATVSGLGILGMIAASSTFPSVSPTFAVMMGLGVGIDYALFLSTRHRQLLIDGVDPATAAERTMATSGRAVLVAATTVVVALLSLYASGVNFMGQLGVAGAVAVAVGAAGALTLVPALLGLLGRRIDRLPVRRPVAEASTTGGGWGRYARRVGAHPWRFLIAGVALLCVLAIPFFSMRLGHVDAGANPPNTTSRQAYDEISAAFGPGANGPFTIAVSLPAGISAADTQALGSRLHQALLTTPDVSRVSAVRPNSTGTVLVATVVPRSSPEDPATDALQTTLRDKTLPAALGGTGARGYVTGTTSEQLDFRNQITSRLPIIVFVVVAIAFLLLLVSFRSPVLALKAAVLNLLSIGAAYGVIVAVFQWGWGGSALGVGGKIPIESYIPMLMFAIVFGLSMDYEVFLLSRVREAWLRTGDNHQSVATGLAATARVISCAALIMTSVFLAFLLSTNVVIKVLALGLGASILIDATVIRLVIVPATMFLLGRYNWWTPRWLDRILPGGGSGGGSPAVPRPAPVGQGSGAQSEPAVRRARHRLAAVAAVALGAGVLSAFGLTVFDTSSAQTNDHAKAKGGPRSAISATVGASQVEERSLTSQLTLAGTVAGADGEVSLTPQTAGTVTSLSISAGQSVAAGQAVAHLSDTQGLVAKQAAAQAQLAQAQATLAQAQSPASQPSSVAQAQAQVSSAQSALDNAQAKQAADQAAASAGSSAPTSIPSSGRTGALAATTTTTTPSSLQLPEDATAVSDAQNQLAAARQELATAENPPPAGANVIAADQAAVTAAQDNLNAANQAVAQLTVTAPVAGTVAQILVPVGGYASPANPIATLAGSTETLTAQASPFQVAALDGKVGEKATASLAVPGPTTTVAATLASIAPAADATTQQTGVTFATSAALQSNAPVSIDVDLPQPPGPTVPADAIVDVNGRSGVYLLTGVIHPAALGVKLPAEVPAGTEVGKASFTPVTTGITQNGITQVLSGLTAGQTVVTTGQSDLAGLSGSHEVAILPTGPPATGRSPSAAAKPKVSGSRLKASASKLKGSGATSKGSGPGGKPGHGKPGHGKHGKKGSRTIDVTVVALHGNRLTVSTPIGDRTFPVPAGVTITDHAKRVPITQLHHGDVLRVTLARKNGKLTVASASVVPPPETEP